MAEKKKRGSKPAPVSQEKAKKILRDGEVKGEELTARQKKFFGRIAGGARTVRV